MLSITESLAKSLQNAGSTHHDENTGEGSLSPLLAVGLALRIISRAAWLLDRRDRKI
jgi:hypothetical protein